MSQSQRSEFGAFQCAGGNQDIPVYSRAGSTSTVRCRARRQAMIAFRTGRDAQRTACAVAIRSIESTVRYVGTLILILLAGGVPFGSDRCAQAATMVRVDAVVVEPERVSVGVRPQITVRIS